MGLASPAAAPLLLPLPLLLGSFGAGADGAVLQIYDINVKTQNKQTLGVILVLTAACCYAEQQSSKTLDTTCLKPLLLSAHCKAEQRVSKDVS